MSASPPRLVYLLNRARQSLMTDLNARSDAALGISATQLGALFVVAENDGCSVRQLRDAMQIDGSAVTGLIKRMQAAGVLEKRADPADRRASQLFITAKGKAAVAQGSEQMRRIHSEMTEGFSAEEIQLVARFLHSLNEKFSQ